MRIFFIFLMLALLIGVGLSLSLPKFQSTSMNLSVQESYKINQDSLSSPIPMKDFLLITPIPNDATFTLRLGLYSQLQHAITSVESISLPIETIIIKATDGYREWYLVLQGKYEKQSHAEQQQQWLQNNQIPATLILWPRNLVLKLRSQQ